MMKFIRWLIFIKIVSQVVKRLKKIKEIKKDCDKKDGDNYVSNKMNLVVM